MSPADLHASATPGHRYGGFGWSVGPDRKGVAFALIWTDAETTRTGRRPSDLFALPSDPVGFSVSVRVDDGPFHTFPSVTYLRDDPGADAALYAAMDAEGTGADFVTAEATTRRAETVVRRVWIRLTKDVDGAFKTARQALMVLAAETEPCLTPRTVEETLPDGRVRNFEWHGVPMLHDRLRFVWKQLVGGAPAADVLEGLDEMNGPFNVPPALGAAQRSLLAYCLAKRDEALPEARTAERVWRAAEYDLNRAEQFVPALPLPSDEAIQRAKANPPPGTSEPDALTLTEATRRLVFIDAVLVPQHLGLGGWKAVAEALSACWLRAGLPQDRTPYDGFDPDLVRRANNKYRARKRAA